MDAASEEQLQTALAAIAATHPDADVVRMGVAEQYAVAHPESRDVGSRLLYLNARRREALREGDEYVTWVVTLFRGEPVEVSFFRSRACSTGDDTLPP
jgi:hypothetical protein